jgi:hypothetical protein
MVAEVRLCEGCAHYRRTTMGMWCIAPQRPNQVSMVDGSRQIAMAGLMRGDRFCGAEARWFEPMPAPPASLWQRIIRRFNGG